ncbi:hypothetical protein Q3G72_012231 [Acer saccharum]|nr:hypothetical protein Q3G72_002307 [Acer saccharum]KAK1562455.1 hypothetical protein Q3G72_012231 [Acer saccharum]
MIRGDLNKGKKVLWRKQKVKSSFVPYSNSKLVIGKGWVEHRAAGSSDVDSSSSGSSSLERGLNCNSFKYKDDAPEISLAVCLPFSGEQGKEDQMDRDMIEVEGETDILNVEPVVRTPKKRGRPYK